ncbi:MAG: hypothetical protein K2X28_04400 [Alphaproteobacteria bacterium]|nr:hypothetical protein [Alphaproteobacteria bacterium]
MVFESLVSEALPIPGRASSLRRDFNLSLIESIQYLIEVCSEVVPAPLFTQVQQKMKTIKLDLKLSSFLSLLHYELFNAAEKNDIKQVNSIIDCLNVEEPYAENLKFLSLSDLDARYLTSVKTIFSQEINREVQFFPLSSSEFKVMETALQRGLGLYKDAFPGFYEEFEQLIGEILLLKAKGLYQGSSTDLYGMIYKSFFHQWEKVTDVFEFFVHEQSHHYLFIVNKNDPLLLNPRDIHFSPIRKEKRPLMGIYHANFILSRVCYVLDNALSNNVIPMEERSYCVDFLEKYKECFYEGLKTLETHGQFTSLGKAILESVTQLVESITLKSTKKTA